ncbi:MAG: hypothetical protein ACRED1_13610, partial [Limisphaerales bacterium]
MNRKSLFWEIALLVLTLSASAVSLPVYQFASVSNSVTAGASLDAVANNGNIFVCVGSQSAPVLSVNTNNFAAFAANNAGGGYLLFSNAWTNSLESPIKTAGLNCVAIAPNGFIASGASNSVLVSSDGVNWSNWGHVLAAGEQAYSVDGIAYNPVSGTFGAALAVYEASWTTNPITTNVWQIAGLQTESFAESFRGITSFASSNMALCGIFGDIRVSPDGGRTWRLSQQIDLKYPNLLSVASDGGSNLVCAGDYSMLEVSTNGGPDASSWNFQTNLNFGLSAALTNFNTVAYSPAIGQFLAAGALGNNGLIAMASETPGRAQWTWTRQTNLWQYQDGVLAPMSGIPSALNGATVATGGFFQGIAMLVGDNGTVMIGGFSPLAPLNLSNTDITNVLTNPPTNGVLTATVNWDFNHPIDVLTVDWFASRSGGAPLALNTLAFQPTNESCGTFTNWAQARDLRTGFVSANRTPFVFTILPGAPSDPISATNCGDVNGQFGMCDTTPLSVTVVTNGANPPGAILVNWYDANSNLVAANVSPNDDAVVTYAPVVSPGIYTFYAQATNPATGLASVNWTPLTYQENELPQWSASAEYFTNVLTASFQTNPILTAVAITNLSAITSIEPGAQIVVDWYTSPDPAVSTYGNPEAPVAFGGASTSGAIWGTPGGIVSGSGTFGNFIPTNRVCGAYTYYARARTVDPANATSCACQSTNLVPITFV